MKYLVGIDEAGRGPLAGPVAVGVVCVPLSQSGRALHPLLNARGTRGRAKDSKQLSETAREVCFNQLQKAQKEGTLSFSAALVGPEFIDRQGITAAVRLGIRRSLARLTINPEECAVLLDGLLKAPSEFRFQKTITHGDAIEPIIALASIVAKVTRDKKMRHVHTHYPAYRFDLHKGYGTRVHYEMIRKKGPCAIHRRTFLRNVLYVW